MISCPFKSISGFYYMYPGFEAEPNNTCFSDIKKAAEQRLLFYLVYTRRILYHPRSHGSGGFHPSEYPQNAVSAILTPSQARWVTSTAFLSSTANGGLTSGLKYWNPINVNVGSK